MRPFIVPLALCLASLQPAHAGADFVVIPGGVADSAGKVGYLSNPKGGVVAVGLDKGDVLWESKDANRPFALVGNRLAALAPEKGKANALRIVVLDTEAKGKKLLESEPIVLPDWVVVGAGYDRHEMGKSFTARADMEKGKLRLGWWAYSRYWGGARPTEEILRAAMKDAHGIALIDLESGKHEGRITDKAAAPMPTGLVEVAKLPKEAQEVAKREAWQAAALVGKRAFGRLERSADGKKGVFFGGSRVFWLQALDLETRALLWERAFEEQRIIPPPP